MARVKAAVQEVPEAVPAAVQAVMHTVGDATVKTSAGSRSSRGR